VSVIGHDNASRNAANISIEQAPIRMRVRL
jgi:hypothetical protein